MLVEMRNFFLFHVEVYKHLELGFIGSAHEHSVGLGWLHVLQTVTSAAVVRCHIRVVACALKSSRKEYELQKIICHKTVSGLKSSSSDVSWMLQG